jgi:2-succinyl-6-hydroxy-2,4-cyclohexadiene-1-carboxylate synthase
MPNALFPNARPTLLFFHGFLGSIEDWNPLIEHLEGNFDCIAIDWTRGKEVMQSIRDEVDRLPAPYAYVGYSMGGRIALQLPNLIPSIILSSHLGLDTEEERAARWKDDQTWIDMLETQPIGYFLEKWYAQPLFASLHRRPALFQAIKAKRSLQNPSQLASILRQMSLAKQNKITSLHPRTLFLFGKEDLKYEQLYAKLSSHLLRQSIANAGHAVHLENPQGCAEAIQQWSQCYANM